MQQDLNPYKPGVPFLGHRQTYSADPDKMPQNALFAHRNFYQKYDKKEKGKKYTRHPLNEKWTRPIDKDGKVH